MAKRSKKSDSASAEVRVGASAEAHTEDLELFLNQVEEEMGPDGEDGSDEDASAGEQLHRRLRVIVSEDRLGAYLEAVFPDTTLAEVHRALKREGVVWGVQEDIVEAALERAERSGKRQNDVVAAAGKTAVYKKRMQVSYPFLTGLRLPDVDEPVHLASSVFREILQVMVGREVDRIRHYSRPVVGVQSGEMLMLVQGREEIEAGHDVFGKEIRTVSESGPSSLKAGEGVIVRPDGSITASRFGYVSVVGDRLSVVSPIWISPDRMAAYFVNPPQLGGRRAPDADEVVKELHGLGVRFGTDRDEIDQLCNDLEREIVRESCIRVARGEHPNLDKGQIRFAFEPLLPVRFEAIRASLQAPTLEATESCNEVVPVFSAGSVLAQQAQGEDAVGPGKDLFGNPVAPPERVQKQRLYKAGPHVRREVSEGLVEYISEIYGYAGVKDDVISVVSPIWVSPDKMTAHFVSFPQNHSPVPPSKKEVEALLERARVRHGIDGDAIVRLSTGQLGKDEQRTVLLARGIEPKPGSDGSVELLYKQMPDPGKLLESGKMDFRERDAVPLAQPDEHLATRTLSTPGVPGRDVRGRLMKAPKSKRELLYAGPNVRVEERDGAQFFFATGSGYARVIKDTLGVMQRFRQQGDVDYQTGNLKMDGDVEIQGTVKSRFRVEATGDITVEGSIERGAVVTAGGNVVVRGGIIGSKVKAGSDLHTLFIQDSEVGVEGDLLVRNYIRDSKVIVKGKASVQGDKGGKEKMCLLGGTLSAAMGVEAASIGAPRRRQTCVAAGIDPEADKRLNRYRKGLAYCDLKSRQAMESVETVVGRQTGKENLAEAIRRVAPARRPFLKGLLKDLARLREMRESCEHHIEVMEESRKDMVERGRVRVLGTVFPQTVVQIGKAVTFLEQKAGAVDFYLTADGDRIVQKLL